MDGDYYRQPAEVIRSTVRDLCAGVDPREERKRLLRTLGVYLRKDCDTVAAVALEIYGKITGTIDLFTSDRELAVAIAGVADTVGASQSELREGATLVRNYLAGNDAGTVVGRHSKEDLGDSLARTFVDRGLSRCHAVDVVCDFEPVVARNADGILALTKRVGACLTKHGSLANLRVPGTSGGLKPEGGEEL